jgi:protein subunit release factor B
MGSFVDPQPPKIFLPASDEELQAECSFQTYRASGPGGQHLNVTESAVRLIHLPTGLTVTSQKERSQILNKKDCLKKLRQLVAKMNYRKPKRIPTRMPAAQKRKILEKKAKHSQKKTLRRLPKEDNAS